MPKKAKPRTLDPTLPIYRLKISLQRVKPLIWRRLEIDDCYLDELHDIIQFSMGWENEHLYAFQIGREEYTDLDRAGGGDFQDACSIRLSDLVERGIQKFSYEYDFGDSWKHTIDVEKTLPPSPGVRYPRCVKGERACPPEDCGGPLLYPYFVEKIGDPSHPDHEEASELAGDDFDPEQFDLEETNRELFRLRCCLGYGKSRHAPKAAFAEEDLVRVKPGTVHRDYADLPLGGWVAVVTRVAWLTPIGYEVRWTRPTLERAHPVYAKRCRRDRLPLQIYWLEEDQLKAAVDETPVNMEEPAHLVTRPLSTEIPEDRVRAVLGLTTDDPLPPLDEEMLSRYLGFLKARLVFPFRADYWPPSDDAPKVSGEVSVEGFADPAIGPARGIMCVARAHGRVFQAPLCGMHAKESDPNLPLVEDYVYWYWETEEEEDEESWADEDEEDLEDDGFDDGDLSFDEPGACGLDGELPDDEPPDDPTRSRAEFPIGTVALYGPNDKRTTKIVAGVIKARGAEPILKRWMASDLETNPKVPREIHAFFNEHGVKSIAATDSNIGCPHEEGEDFPIGEDCPFCPWWKGKQGTRRRT